MQSASFATVLLDSDSAGRAAPRQRKRGGEVDAVATYLWIRAALDIEWTEAQCTAEVHCASGELARLAWCTARSGKLYRARSWLYRGRILQENMRLKALVEIYAMHSFAQLWNGGARRSRERAGGADVDGRLRPRAPRRRRGFLWAVSLGRFRLPVGGGSIFDLPACLLQNAFFGPRKHFSARAKIVF